MERKEKIISIASICLIITALTPLIVEFIQTTQNNFINLKNNVASLKSDFYDHEKINSHLSEREKDMIELTYKNVLQLCQEAYKEGKINCYNVEKP